MAMTAADSVLVDTNVLVYANVATAPLHAPALTTLRNLANAGTALWISRQVIREYLAVLSRPQTYSAPQPANVLASQIQYFLTRFQMAEDGADVTNQLIALMQRLGIGGKQVHDGNLVATMLTHGIPTLLTHNVNDFSRYSQDITVMPLVP